MATSFAQRIVIRGLITPTVRSVSIAPNPDDGVSSSEWLNLAAFEQMKFSKASNGRVCWIYLRNHLMPLPNIDRTALLSWANLYFLLGDEELA